MHNRSGGEEKRPRSVLYELTKARQDSPVPLYASRQYRGCVVHVKNTYRAMLNVTGGGAVETHRM